MNVSQCIEDLVRKYVEVWRVANTAEAINNGYCMDFADFLLKYPAVANDGFFIMDSWAIRSGVVMDEYEVHDQGHLNWSLLEGYGISPPSDLSQDDLDKVYFAYHVWVTNGYLHYDSESPEGVASPFDLPIFKRDIERHLAKPVPAQTVTKALRMS